MDSLCIWSQEDLICDCVMDANLHVLPSLAIPAIYLAHIPLTEQVKVRNSSLYILQHACDRVSESLEYVLRHSIAERSSVISHVDSSTFVVRGYVDRDIVLHL